MIRVGNGVGSDPSKTKLPIFCAELGNLKTFLLAIECNGYRTDLRAETFDQIYRFANRSPRGDDVVHEIPRPIDVQKLSGSSTTAPGTSC